MKPWIQTYGGARHYVLAPDPATISIEAIAHSLALTCRYGGHCAWHYSVAQHSVLVSRLCDKADAKWGLLHDAAEAYIGDMVKPLKDTPALAAYCDIEDRHVAAICRRFGLAGTEPESVLVADRETAHALEVRTLMQPIDREWAIYINGIDAPPWAEIERLTPAQAEEQFLARWAEIHAAETPRRPNPSLDAEQQLSRSDD